MNPTKRDDSNAKPVPKTTCSLGLGSGRLQELPGLLLKFSLPWISHLRKANAPVRELTDMGGGECFGTAPGPTYCEEGEQYERPHTQL